MDFGELALIVPEVNVIYRDIVHAHAWHVFAEPFNCFELRFYYRHNVTDWKMASKRNILDRKDEAKVKEIGATVRVAMGLDAAQVNYTSDIEFG